MNELLDLLDSLDLGIDFTRETALIDDAILESLDIVSIIAELSEAYDITIPAREIIPENFNSASSIMALIERLQED